jgi:hypothetical protein
VTGRPGYAPADLLKLYIYGYLNRVRTSRRLETRLAPALSADSRIARRSTAVEPDGTHTMINGVAKLRRLCRQLAQTEPAQGD